MFLLPGGSEQALIEAIRATNPGASDLTMDDLYFGKVKQSTTQGYVEAPVVAMYNSRFTGYLRLEYKRIDLGRAYNGVKPQVKRVGYPTLWRLLPIINETLGLSLSENDVADVDITWINDNEQINIPIITKSSSLGYEGQFIVEYHRVRPELASIAMLELDVMQHPIDPAIGKKSLAMLLWSEDFTEDKEALTVLWGKWWYHDKVVRVMAARGFPNWPQASGDMLGVYDTTKYKGANTAFTHVIVQKDLSFPDSQGTALIHYNG